MLTTTHQFILWVDIVDDATVLNGRLHVTRPQRLDDRSEGNDARSAGLGEHVKLHALFAATEEVWATVEDQDSLVGVRERHRSDVLGRRSYCAPDLGESHSLLSFTYLQAENIS